MDTDFSIAHCPFVGEGFLCIWTPSHKGWPIPDYLGAKYPADSCGGPGDTQRMSKHKAIISSWKTDTKRLRGKSSILSHNDFRNTWPALWVQHVSCTSFRAPSKIIQHVACGRCTLYCQLIYWQLLVKIVK